MAFSDEVKEQAMQRAEFRCECHRNNCATHYMQRCPSNLNMITAEFVRKRETVLGDADRLENCEVLCQYCCANKAMDQFQEWQG